MNYLVIEPEEVVGNQVHLKGARAADLIKAHELKEGLNISVLVVGGLRGKASVQKASNQELVLEIHLTETSLAKNPITLIVGLCRPQSVKKVIAAAMAYGVQDLEFVRTANTEKSYLDSKIWNPENLKNEVTLAMAQTGDSIAVKINRHQKFLPFLDTLASREGFTSATKRLADGRATSVLNCGELASYSYLAIGPEKGWTEYEIEQFSGLGFQSFSMGPRMMRIEHAVGLGLAQCL